MSESTSSVNGLSLAGTCSFVHCAKWRNLKRRGWDINFLNMRPCDRYLTQFDFFSNYFLVDRWCIISESFNHISDHGVKSLLGSVISTIKSQCVAKFQFDSMFKRNLGFDDNFLSHFDPVFAKICH